jgi:hypothetical protein
VGRNRRLADFPHESFATHRRKALRSSLNRSSSRHNWRARFGELVHRPVARGCCGRHRTGDSLLKSWSDLDREASIFKSHKWGTLRLV